MGLRVQVKESVFNRVSGTNVPVNGEKEMVVARVKSGPRETESFASDGFRFLN